MHFGLKYTPHMSKTSLRSARNAVLPDSMWMTPVSSWVCTSEKVPVAASSPIWAGTGTSWPSTVSWMCTW